jgi:hypothetical protein
MYRREPRHQLSFIDFFLPFGGKLSGDNRWIKLAELLPWAELWSLDKKLNRRGREHRFFSNFCITWEQLNPNAS